MITKLRLRCMAIAMLIGVCGAFAQTADFSGTFGGTTIGDVYTFTGQVGLDLQQQHGLVSVKLLRRWRYCVYSCSAEWRCEFKFKFEFKPTQ